MQNIAHVKKCDKDPNEWLVHDLSEHLSVVAEKARKFADTFGNGDWAQAAGL